MIGLFVGFVLGLATNNMWVGVGACVLAEGTLILATLIYRYR